MICVVGTVYVGVMSDGVTEHLQGKVLLAVESSGYLGELLFVSHSMRHYILCCVMEHSTTASKYSLCIVAADQHEIDPQN